jgi:hypothetical protein
MAAMLFPGALRHSDTTESFTFTIRYKHGEDMSLAEHRDASVATLNLNLNTPGGDYDAVRGSELYFVDENDPTLRYNVSFGEPGMALLHKGALRHAARTIEGGERHNLIVWLFGRNGEVRVAPYQVADQMGVTERWQRLAGGACDVS